MSYDQTTEALFERVLDALTRAEGSDMTLMDNLADIGRDTRALAMIRALLAADATIAATFSDAGRDRDLARATAMALTGSADRIEAETPARAPVRMADVLALRARD